MEQLLPLPLLNHSINPFRNLKFEHPVLIPAAVDTPSRNQDMAPLPRLINMLALPRLVARHRLGALEGTAATQRMGARFIR